MQLYRTVHNSTITTVCKSRSCATQVHAAALLAMQHAANTDAAEGMSLTSAGLRAVGGAATAAGFLDPGWNLLKLPFTTPAGALAAPAGLATMLLAWTALGTIRGGCWPPAWHNRTRPSDRHSSTEEQSCLSAGHSGFADMC